MSSPKKPRKNCDLEYKRRIVQEYLQSGIKSAELAKRDGIDRGEIYK